MANDMLRVAFVAALLCCGVCTVAGRRLPRSEDDYYDSDCDDCGEGFICVEEKCLQLATESRNVCEVDEQCRNLTGVCYHGKCAVSVGLAEECNSSADCNGTSVCRGGICCSGDECPKVVAPCANETCCGEGFIESDDQKSCLQLATKLGDFCNSTRQCETVNGTCTGGVCIRVPLLTRVHPLANSLIASSCIQNSDCAAVNDAVCADSICQCKDHFIPSENRSKCLSIAKKPGDGCTLDKQCSKIGSTCLDGKCVAVAAAGVTTRNSGTRCLAKIAAIAVAAASLIL